MAIYRDYSLFVVLVISAGKTISSFFKLTIASFFNFSLDVCQYEIVIQNTKKYSDWFLIPFNPAYLQACRVVCIGSSNGQIQR
jgi:hypothetical protein